jgi:hypothetical protein
MDEITKGFSNHLGISIRPRILMRARAKLGVVAQKDGFDGKWILKLPEECQEGAKSASQKGWHSSEDLAPFNNDGGAS